MSVSLHSFVGGFLEPGLAAMHWNMQKSTKESDKENWRRKQQLGVILMWKWLLVCENPNRVDQQGLLMYRRLSRLIKSTFVESSGMLRLSMFRSLLLICRIDPLGVGMELDGLAS